MIQTQTIPTMIKTQAMQTIMRTKQATQPIQTIQQLIKQIQEMMIAMINPLILYFQILL
jgi:hypothetical protein